MTTTIAAKNETIERYLTNLRAELREHLEDRATLVKGTNSYAASTGIIEALRAMIAAVEGTK